MTPMRRDTTLEEAVRVMNMSDGSEESTNDTGTELS